MATNSVVGGKQKNAIDLKDQIQIQNKPIRSMRLFSEWDVENAAANCIPRSCCLRVVKLQVFNALESELKAMVICVAMQGSRRSLRSDQIPVQPSGTLEVELDLVFTLQYPHFLKRRENRLQIMLQRRKKYKNRTILGYKNLAVGHVNMAQVLQGWFSNQLHLYAKGQKSPVATLTIATLSSDPIDRDVQDRRLNLVEHQDSTDEEADDDSFSSDEDSAGEMDSAREVYSRRHPSRRHKVQSRRNFKQKIIQALFKNFRVSDEDLGEVQKELQKEFQAEYDIVEDEEALYFDDDFNDSENDDDMLDDNVSIASVKRPGLRPFFDHSKSQTTLNQSSLTKEEAQQLSLAVTEAMHENHTSQEENSDEHPNDNENNENKNMTVDKQMSLFEPLTDAHEHQDKDSLKEPFVSGSEVLATKESLASTFSDQLTSVLGNDDKIPEYLLLVSAKEQFSQNLAQKLRARLGYVLGTSSSADIQASVAAITNKLQKYCNRHSVSPPLLRIGVFGPESYLRDILKSYVEQFSNRTPDYQNFVKFLIIPTGYSKTASYLSFIDPTYNSLFMDTFWKSVFAQSFITEPDSREVEKRILQYIENGELIHQLPIAQALITAKNVGNAANSSQFFVPFITEVRMGSSEVLTNDVDSDSAKEYPDKQTSSTLSSSPRNDLTDNRSNISLTNENLDLLVDYWPLQSYNSTTQMQGKKEEKKEVNKLSIKSTFRSLCVSRLPDSEETNGLIFGATLKNRKKVKRIMKQRGEKDSESISVPVNKVVCTARNSNYTFNVSIDGKEWTNVKFFSLSHQWPTHIKQFPVAIFMNYDPT